MIQLGVALTVLVGVTAVVMAAPAVTRVILTDERCGLLALHVPARDVATEPGRDAAGRPVVPHDLDPARAVALPADITIDITAALFALLEREPPRGLAPSEIDLGQVVFGQDGRITYNGQPLGDSVQDGLVAICRNTAGSGARSR